RRDPWDRGLAKRVPLTRGADRDRLRLPPPRAARAPRPPHAPRRPAGAGRDALPSRGHGVVAEAGPGQAHRTLPGGRDLRGGRAARPRVPAAPARPRGRAGHRPRARGVPAPGALGGDREVELLGPPLPRAHLPEPPRAGHELLRGLREPARRPDAPGLLPARESRALRPDARRLDDLGR